MYRRPKFLEILLEIREEMSREVDYDVDLFAEMIKSSEGKRHIVKGGSSDEGLMAETEPAVIEKNKLGSLDLGFGILDG